MRYHTAGIDSGIRTPGSHDRRRPAHHLCQGIFDHRLNRDASRLDLPSMIRRAVVRQLHEIALRHRSRCFGIAHLISAGMSQSFSR